jgi:hypothetical protein
MYKLQQSLNEGLWNEPVVAANIAQKYIRIKHEQFDDSLLHLQINWYLMKRNKKKRKRKR